MLESRLGYVLASLNLRSRHCHLAEASAHRQLLMSELTTGGFALLGGDCPMAKFCRTTSLVARAEVSS